MRPVGRRFGGEAAGLLRQLGQRRIGVGDGEALGPPVRVEEIGEAPIGQIGHGEPGHARQRILIVERFGQVGARLGHEARDVLDALAFGDVLETAHRRDRRTIHDDQRGIDRPVAHLLATDRRAVEDRARQRVLLRAVRGPVGVDGPVAGVATIVGVWQEGMVQEPDRLRIMEEELTRGESRERDADRELFEDGVQAGALVRQRRTGLFARGLGLLARGHIPHRDGDTIGGGLHPPQ